MILGYLFALLTILFRRNRGILASMSTTELALTSIDLHLDASASALGELRSSTDVVDDPAVLGERMREEGYLFLRGYLDADEVLEARAEITRRLAGHGLLDENYPAIEAVSKPGAVSPSFDVLTENNRPLKRLLYAGRMMALHERLLVGAVRHYDFTWLRAVPGGGKGVYPHCDVVYMGRGTWNLLTAWTPLGDVPFDVGGLMILEDSHRKAAKLRRYLGRDVDAYCTNYPDAAEIESGKKLWQNWDGRLSSDPVALREKLGGRWLTTEFRAGDVLTFTMGTIHASLDNHSNRFRISSDSRYQLASEPIDERWIGDKPVGHGPAGKKGKIC